MPSSVSSPWQHLAAVALAAAVTVALALPFVASARAAAGDVTDGGASRDAGGACVAVRAEARYVPYGWSHVVVLASSCTRDASCVVSTDVNPERQTVEVPRGATVSVVTFLSSPSQTFTPAVACTLR